MEPWVKSGTINIKPAKGVDVQNGDDGNNL